MYYFIYSITRSIENPGVLQNLANDNASEAGSLYHSVMPNVITPQEVHSVHTTRTFVALVLSITNH